MNSMTLLLIILCFTLFCLWRAECADVRYWCQQSARYQDKLYRSWIQQRRLLERLNERDPADWWKNPYNED